jgi:hypothetical protein
MRIYCGPNSNPKNAKVPKLDGVSRLQSIFHRIEEAVHQKARLSGRNVGKLSGQALRQVGFSHTTSWMKVIGDRGPGFKNSITLDRLKKTINSHGIYETSKAVLTLNDFSFKNIIGLE